MASAHPFGASADLDDLPVLVLLPSQPLPQ